MHWRTPAYHQLVPDHTVEPHSLLSIYCHLKKTQPNNFRLNSYSAGHHNTIHGVNGSRLQRPSSGGSRGRRLGAPVHGTKGGGTKEGRGRAKIMRHCITKNMSGRAQTGNLAQGSTRKHRSASAYIREIDLKYCIINTQDNQTAILRFLMPWRYALLSYNTSWSDQNLSKRFLKVLTVSAETI